MSLVSHGGAYGPADAGDEGSVADPSIAAHEDDSLATNRTDRASRWPDPASPSPRSATANGGPMPAAFPVPERPPLPKPERLNRNALTVAAVIMGTLVLAAVIFMPPSRPAPGAGTQSAPVPSTATFLDQPVAGQVGAPTGVATPSAAPSTVPPGSVPPRVSPDPYAITPLPSPTQPPGATGPAPLLPSPRVLAYEAALAAPLTASEARRATAMSATGQADVVSAGDVALGPTPVAPSNAAGPSADGGTLPPIAVSGSPHERFLAQARTQQAHVVRPSVAPAPGPYALLAGTMIPAVLVTEINSDLPGEVLAQVARDVFDSRTQRAVLVPRGARLLGVYEHEVGGEQRRLVVAWTRLLFPDGRSVALPALQAKDRSGAGGLADQVDRHESRVFGTAALLSLIGAGAQLAQPNGGYGAWGSAPSTGQVMAGAVGQQLADVATQMLRRDLEVRPTIHVRQGLPFNVFLNVDLAFAAPYTADRGPEP